jgi:hypothetical protein
MLFLGHGCNIYFPMFVFDRFRVVRQEWRPGKSGKRDKEQSDKKDNIYDCTQSFSQSEYLS